MNDPVVIIFNWFHIIVMCFGWTIASCIKIIVTEIWKK